MSEHPSSTRESTITAWWVVSCVIGLAALLLAAIALAAGLKDDSSATASGAPAVEEIELDIELGDLYVKPSAIEVPAGQVVVLNVYNRGAMPHDLKVDGTTGTQMIDPGAAEKVRLGPFEASTTAWCTRSPWWPARPCSRWHPA